MTFPSALPHYHLSPNQLLPEGAVLLEAVNLIGGANDSGLALDLSLQKRRGEYITLDLLVLPKRQESAQQESRQVQIITDQSQIPDEVTVVDGQTWFMGSSLVDLYSTSGEPGYESRETLHSLQQAARAGGFGLVGILPQTEPVLDDLGALEFLVHHSPKNIHQNTHQGLHLKPWAALTNKAEGKQLNDLSELAPHVLGFTDGQPLQNLLLVQRALDYLQPLGKPLMLFAQDLHLLGDGVVRDGKWCVQYGYSGAPLGAETSALAALLEIVQPHHGTVHLMRISTARSVALLRQAKAAGLPITASVVWTHLCYCDQDLHTYDSSLRLMPPLGSAEDRAALVAGLKDGTIDAIAVDHTPYTYEEKAVPFDTAPVGAAGLEVAWAMLWQHLVTTGQLSPQQLWQGMTDGPLRCLGLTMQELNLTPILFVSNASWQVNASHLHSLAANVPCWHQELKGKFLGLSVSV